MPNGNELGGLQNLAGVPPRGQAMPSEARAPMEAMPARAAAPGQGPEGADAGAGEDAKMAQVAQGMKQMTQVAHEMMTAMPQITPIIKDSIEQLYMKLAKFFGVEQEAKLAMTKGRGQMQQGGMNQMSQMGR